MSIVIAFYSILYEVPVKVLGTHIRKRTREMAIGMLTNLMKTDVFELSKEVSFDFNLPW